MTRNVLPMNAGGRFVIVIFAFEMSSLSPCECWRTLDDSYPYSRNLLSMNAAGRRSSFLVSSLSSSPVFAIIAVRTHKPSTARPAIEASQQSCGAPPASPQPNARLLQGRFPSASRACWQIMMFHHSHHHDCPHHPFLSLVFMLIIIIITVIMVSYSTVLVER